MKYLKKYRQKIDFMYVTLKKIKTFIHNSIKLVSVVMKTLSYRQKKTSLDSYLSQLIIMNLLSILLF